MLEAHLKVARGADNSRVICLVVKLAVVASLAQAPAEVCVGREVVEKVVAVVSVEKGEKGGGRKAKLAADNWRIVFGLLRRECLTSQTSRYLRTS